MAVVAVVAAAATAAAMGCASGKVVHREAKEPSRSSAERLRLTSEEVPDDLAKATEQLQRVPDAPPPMTDEERAKRAQASGASGGAARAAIPDDPEPETPQVERSVLDAVGGKGEGADPAAAQAEATRRAEREAELLKQPFSQAVVAQLIELRMADVNTCYELVVSSGIDVEGDVTVEFVIGETGEVKTYDARETTVQHQGVVACVLNAVASWRFPGPTHAREVTVAYPFKFRLNP